MGGHWALITIMMVMIMTITGVIIRMMTTMISGCFHVSTTTLTTTRSLTSRRTASVPEMHS